MLLNDAIVNLSFFVFGEYIYKYRVILIKRRDVSLSSHEMGD